MRAQLCLNKTGPALTSFVVLPQSSTRWTHRKPTSVARLAMGRMSQNRTISAGRSLPPSSSTAPRSCIPLLYLLSPSTVDVLSFRFDKDNTQQDKKLDDMDLDDILNRAEDHETITGGDGGASLGGESFLASVAFVSDIKTEMTWEEIIPVEERQKAELEEDQRKAEELAALDTKDRKRSHAPVSYEGMDVDQPLSASTSKKPKGPAPTRKSASQKAMELKERDVRVLIRSMQKWGDIRQRYDIIVCSPKL